MIEIVDIRYCRLGTADLDSTVAFATNLIGLEEVDRADGQVYLRGDHRDHNICYFEGDPNDHTFGLEVETLDALDAAATTLQAAGIDMRRGSDAEAVARRVMGFINFKDPTGNSVDLVVRPFHSGRRYFPSRDAGITEFSHIGIKTDDAARDEKFWSGLFNIRANDRIGDAALMSFDKVHHRIALFPTDHAGIQHINFQVESIDDIMRSHYFLTERQVQIRFGPGRHPTSGAMFLYYEGPDGMTYEYSSGVRNVDADWRPRQLPFKDESFCMWGARPNIPEFSDN
ncbi:MAG: glyoxalase/bleomycin resistance/extradiol dioxygenase family protein [Rhodospirillaceae bacterium]|jgi:2,3-dihydroxy-p-cumate/2,3-dihydroxybenzoate 3,4-dioxygenase|nr:glyoxalase/bleomycin resistance/extradiol dioxygenase family protein [Rhodospirillaceae bacterium]MBT5943502.1 glyoxalase/bleomycin resistance/extradiol dioxygenase family protein [Rhodospirillaceae bacterium]MBT6404940.1 glyoxalase/bleomycin resistance/extradiol dioxygenase family protein [Rhodospirillaceae bacterium]MBT6537514.1 glyoxalase/bleomycin resistance/extradiol dioxygenase family protein [Rhodospirillaceae bacterium]